MTCKKGRKGSETKESQEVYWLRIFQNKRHLAVNLCVHRTNKEIKKEIKCTSTYHSKYGGGSSGKHPMEKVNLIGFI